VRNVIDKYVRGRGNITSDIRALLTCDAEPLKW
jgi:hypothetical protein